MSLVRPSRRPFFDLNWVVFAVIVAIIGIGLLNLRNADYYSADSFHQRQLKWYLVGTVLAVIVAFVDLHFISRLAYVIYGVTIAMLIAVLFTNPINGSTRWLPIPGLGESLQPAEFAKIGLILALARFFQDGYRDLRPDDGRLMRIIRPALPFALIAPSVYLIFIEPDLGTSLITLFCGLSIVFYEGLRWRSVLNAIVLVAIVIPVGWKWGMHDYQRDRVMAWLYPEEIEAKVTETRQALKQNPDDVAVKKHLEELEETLAKTYQPEQAQKAIGSGGFYGKGGQQGQASRQKSLPYLHTDFVVACYGEERGFAGGFVLLCLYYLLTYWAMKVTKHARDRFQVLSCVGVAGLIFWQFFVNVGMVTGLLPVVGVTLPLLSYGGSSVLTICIGLGVCFNIAFRRRATG